MALRIAKAVQDALTAARIGEKVDLSKLVIPRLAGGRLHRKDNEAVPADDNTTRSFFLSDKSVDRDRDSIDPNGWDLAEFDVNGAVLFAHNNRATPIAEPSNTRVDGKGDNAGLYGDARFPSKEVDPFGALILRLIDDRILKNVSVGFIPLKWTINEERQGIDFQEQKLVEWSVVPVGSHPGAMVQLAKAKSLDLAPLEEWTTKWLDNDESVASAVADDVEMAVLQKALSPWKRSAAGLVVPAATVERAAEVVAPPPAAHARTADVHTDESSPAAEKKADPASKALDLATAIEGAELDEAKAKKLAELLDQAAALLKTPEGVTPEEIAAIVREEIAAAFKANDPEPITVDEVVTMVREAVDDLKADFLRETGRLPH